MTKTKNIIYTIIRIILVAAVICGIVIFLFDKEGSDRPFEEVAAEISQNVTSENMELNTERFFKKFYGFNAADFDGVMIYTPLSNMDADEMLLVKLSDESQKESLVDAIQERIDTRREVFEGYAPEQYDLMKRAVLDVQGNYIFYVVCEDADRLDSVFRAALKGKSVDGAEAVTEAESVEEASSPAEGAEGADGSAGAETETVLEGDTQ